MQKLLAAAEQQGCTAGYWVKLLPLLCGQVIIPAAVYRELVDIDPAKFEELLVSIKAVIEEAETDDSAFSYQVGLNAR